MQVIHRAKKVWQEDARRLALARRISFVAGDFFKPGACHIPSSRSYTRVPLKLPSLASMPQSLGSVQLCHQSWVIHSVQEVTCGASATSGRAMLS